MVRFSAVLGLAIAITAAAAACAEDGAKGRPRPPPPPSGQKPIEDLTKEDLPNVFASLGKGESQITALCSRAGVMDDSNENFNAMTNAFCREGKRPTSLEELRDALGLQFVNPGRDGTNGSNDNPGFALSGHSSSLVAREVSAINPRSFIFSAPAGQPTRIKGFVVMGFARGEEFVEVAAETGKGGKISFYLVKFEHSCGEKCSFGQLLTPKVERDWTNITVYDDEDLKNTILDCRHCHQADGPRSKMSLRMQELEDPWTHWFRSDRPGGITLIQDFVRAHGEDEDYGGIPAALIQKSDGRALEDLVKGQGFGEQPNAFNSRQIEREVAGEAPDQPVINTPRGESRTWQRLFEGALRGDFIPPPYHDVKVTDPNKLQYATDAYRKYMEGGSKELPDIRRVFLDEALPELSFSTRPGASGKEVLTQMCAQCHNPKLDQSITRAKFDVMRLDEMSRSEKKEAIARIKLPTGDVRHMPPALMRGLTEEAKAAAIAELSK